MRFLNCKRFFSSEITKDYKYFVERTSVGRNLPIYTEYRNGGNTCYTIIRKVSGSLTSLAEDLKHVVLPPEEESVKKNRIVRDKWKIREDLGHVWVHGKHSEKIRNFLVEKGF